MGGALSLAERGALALDDAAAALDRAADSATFLDALAHNRRVWSAIKDIARRERWSVPSGRQTAFALVTANKPAVSDDDVHALVAVNRRVSAALAGGGIDRIRERAYFLWETNGRPHGQALNFWLLAEMEATGRQH